MSGLTDAERDVIRAKAAQSGMDGVILYVERIVAARVAAAEQRNRQFYEEGVLHGREAAEAEFVALAAPVMASWGIRSRHGEWSDVEAQQHAARDAFRAALARPTDEATP